SGLEADAFWAKYRSLLVKELPKTEPTTSFEALLKECVARYARAASNTKEACDAALRASGLDTDAFWAKYRSLMVPPKTAKYEAAKAAKNGPADVFEALVRAFKDSCLVTTEVKS